MKDLRLEQHAPAPDDIHLVEAAFIGNNRVRLVKEFALIIAGLRRLAAHQDRFIFAASLVVQRPTK